jgi:hypothetical protein
LEVPCTKEAKTFFYKNFNTVLLDGLKSEQLQQGPNDPNKALKNQIFIEESYFLVEANL